MSQEKKQTTENFSERLDELLHHLRLKKGEFADALGISASHVSGLLQGDRPSRLLLTAIRAVFGVNPEWIEHGEGDILADDRWQGSPKLLQQAKRVYIADWKRQEGVIASLREENEALKIQVEGLNARVRTLDRRLTEVTGDTGDSQRHSESGGGLMGQVAEGYAPPARVAHIPIYDVRAAAGVESFVSDERVETYVTYDAEWVVAAVGSYPENLVGVKVEGDSMEPKLRDGDVVLVDKVQHESRPVTDDVYLFRYRDDLLVKRLIPQAGGGLEVVSFNPKYKPFLIHPEEAEQGGTGIVGRVVWPRIEEA